MRINLIITTYAASHTTVNKQYYLRYILGLLNKIKTNITQITIMKPKINTEHTEYKDFYNFDSIDISNIESRIKIIECENIGISYGQFLNGIHLNQNFDYSIFIEDDYMCFIDYFEEYLVSEYNKNYENSFLTLFYFKSKLHNLYNHIKNYENSEINKEFINRMKKYNYNIDNMFRVPDFSLGIISKSSYQKIINTFKSIDNINYILNIKFRNYWLYQIFFGYILNLSNITVNTLQDKNLNLFYGTNNNKVVMCNFDIDIKDWDKYPYNNTKFDIPIFAPLEFFYPYNQRDIINKLLIYLKEPTKFIERYNFLNEEHKLICENIIEKELISNKNYDDIINIAIIPSYIDSKDSIYTRDERFEQTKKTIATIREKIPQVYIVFIDVSEINQDEIEYLIKNCNLLLNENKNIKLINKIKSGKSYGEKSYIEYALQKLNDFNKNYSFDKFKNLKSIFKIGGRHFLNNSFNYLNFDNDYDVFNIILPKKYSDACQSCLFKINKLNIKNFINILEKYDDQILNYYIDMEKLLYKYIQEYLENICYLHLNILGMTCIPTKGINTHDSPIFDI